VQQVWGSDPEPIKSPTRYQRTTRHRCNLDVWALAQSCGDGHRSLVTLERVLSEYSEDLIYYYYFIFYDSATLHIAIYLDWSFELLFFQLLLLVSHCAFTPTTFKAYEEGALC